VLEAEQEPTEAALPVLPALLERLFEALGPPMQAARAALPQGAEQLVRLEQSAL
jgi:hypothetical protein